MIRLGQGVVGQRIAVDSPRDGRGFSHFDVKPVVVAVLKIGGNDFERARLDSEIHVGAQRAETKSVGLEVGSDVVLAVGREFTRRPSVIVCDDKPGVGLYRCHVDVAEDEADAQVINPLADADGLRVA